MTHDRQTTPTDAQRFVDAPVISALNRIAVVAIIGFAVVAGFAAIPLLFHLEHTVHEAFHLLVPATWLALAAAVLLWRILRPPPAGEHDVWARAAQVDPSLTRYARLVSTLMTIGWLVSFGAVIVHHHLATPRSTFVTFGILVPLTAAAWILAVFAWTTWCRATLAHAEHAAADRLRHHMAEIAKPH
jgi:cobalamin synthase